MLLSMVLSMLVALCGAATTCTSSLESLLSEDKLSSTLLYSGRGLNDLGDLESCEKSNDSRYVLIAAKIPGYSSFRVNLGFCGSRSCTIEDYNSISSGIKPYVLKGFNLTEEQSVDFSFTFPSVLTHQDYSPGFITMLVITCAIVATCLIGTTIEFYYMAKQKKPQKEDINNKETVLEDNRETLIEHKLLAEREKPVICRFFLCFSYRTNITKIVSAIPNPANPRLDVLNGLRVISMMWVIYGHTYYYLLISPMVNPLKIMEYIDNFWYQILFQAPFAVDSFFFLAGFLGAFAMIPEIKARAGKLPFFKLFFHRYYRIMPLYAFLIFMAWKFEPYLNQGPIWPDFQQSFDSGCQKYWWTNIVFLNNFIPWDAPCSCFGWGWYLANDYQFFLITPFLLILYYKRRLWGWAMSFVLLLASFFTTFGLAYDGNYAVDYITLAPGYLDYWNNVYSKPYCRIQPYLIGVILAYLYLEGKEEKAEGVAQRLKKSISSWKFRYCLYFVAFWLITLPVFLPYDANHNPNTWPRAWNAIYIAFSRGVFAFGLSMMIYPVLMGYGRGIYAFLAAGIFTPLARLTFAAYLVHPMIIQMVYYGSKQGIYLDSWRMFFTYAGFLLIAYFMGFLLSVSLESPILGIEKEFIFKRKKEKVEKKEEERGSVNNQKAEA